MLNDAGHRTGPFVLRARARYHYFFTHCTLLDFARREYDNIIIIMVAFRQPVVLILLLVRARASFGFAHLPPRLLANGAAAPTIESMPPTACMATSNPDPPPDEATPHSSVVDMRELSERVDHQLHQYDRLNAAQAELVKGELPHRVHIILFDCHTPHQQVHTIELEYPGYSKQEVVLAFESGSDCLNFDRMLQELQIIGSSVSWFDVEFLAMPATARCSALVRLIYSFTAG